MVPGTLGSAVRGAIASSDGTFVSSSVLARRVGLKNRHTLDRVLQNEGLQTYKQLSGWIRVLRWVVDWENDHVALSRSALRSGKNSGIYPRTVRRVTGLSWSQVRGRGSSWVLLELVSRCAFLPGAQCGTECHTPRPPSGLVRAG